jgi:hypothetical protein
LGRLFYFKGLLYFIIVSILLIFSIKFFQSTQFEEIFFLLHAVFLVISLVLVGLYITNKMNKGRKINGNIKYFLLLMLFAPFYGAMRAYVEFDQPMLYGLLSKRGWAVMGAALFLYYVISTKDGMLQIVESSLVVLAWSSLFYFTYLYVTFDIQSLGAESNFAAFNENKGLKIKLNSFFITFGILYYFIKFNYLRSAKYFLYFALFALYVIFIMQGRAYMIQILIVMSIYLYRRERSLYFSLKIMGMVLILAGGIFSLYLLFPDAVIKMYELFLQMFIVLGGSESTDSSANSRIYQSVKVIDYFTLRPDTIWFGTGSLSRHWNDGYQSIFGYFYPSDIGLLGGLFQYGIFGMIFIWFVPIFLSYKLFKSVELANLSVFLIVIQYLLLLYMFKSFNSGNYIFAMHEYLLCYFILLGGKNTISNNKILL